MKSREGSEDVAHGGRAAGETPATAEAMSAWAQFLAARRAVIREWHAAGASYHEIARGLSMVCYDAEGRLMLDETQVRLLCLP